MAQAIAIKPILVPQRDQVKRLAARQIRTHTQQLSLKSAADTAHLSLLRFAFSPLARKRAWRSASAALASASCWRRFCSRSSRRCFLCSILSSCFWIAECRCQGHKKVSTASLGTLSNDYRFLELPNGVCVQPFRIAQVQR